MSVAHTFCNVRCRSGEAVRTISAAGRSLMQRINAFRFIAQFVLSPEADSLPRRTADLAVPHLVEPTLSDLLGSREADGVVGASCDLWPP